MGGSRKAGSSSSKAGTKSSPTRTARAGPSDVLTVGGPATRRGRAGAGGGTGGRRRAGSVLQSPSSWAPLASEGGADEAHDGPKGPVIRYGSGKRLGQLLRKGAALAAGDGTGQPTIVRRSRSRRRRRKRVGKGKGSRRGGSPRGRSGSPTRKGRGTSAGGAGDDEQPTRADPASALHRAHKGGKALTSEESTELAAALSASAVRNKPLPPVFRPPYTPVRATDPADCSPKALLASCPGALLRQIIEEEGAAWCQRGVGSVMTTTA